MRTSRATILDALAAERDGVNAIEIPDHLVERWRTTPDGVAWLDRLPGIVNEAAERWSLAIGAPFRGQDVTASWVAPVERADGTRAVLKVGVPHLGPSRRSTGSGSGTGTRPSACSRPTADRTRCSSNAASPAGRSAHDPTTSRTRSWPACYSDCGERRPSRIRSETSP
jgi:hypothetical protein